MKAYSCGGYKNHIVIADNMAEAAKVYLKVYEMEPKELKILSDYVIIQEDDSK